MGPDYSLVVNFCLYGETPIPCQSRALLVKKKSLLKASEMPRFESTNSAMDTCWITLSLSHTFTLIYLTRFGKV